MLYSMRLGMLSGDSEITKSPWHFTSCLMCQGDSYSYFINNTYLLINSIRALLTPGEDASK